MFNELNLCIVFLLTKTLSLIQGKMSRIVEKGKVKVLLLCFTKTDQSSTGSEEELACFLSNMSNIWPFLLVLMGMSFNLATVGLYKHS